MIAITPGKLVRPLGPRYNHLLGVVLERLATEYNSPDKFKVLMCNGKVDVWYSHQIGVYD